MDMKEVISLVNTNRGDGRKASLTRMCKLMEKLGNPQEHCRFIHVAGTNGKGTTCAFSASVLQEAGYKTGLFISPHLESINERIRINQKYISNEEFIEVTEEVASSVAEVEEELNETLYSFEILTAVAFVYFAKHACDIVVLETGIGGRLDATNVISTPEVAIMTSIGLDHTSTLGNSLEEIAKEKAGIIKSKGSVICYPASAAILSIFQQKIAEEQGDLYTVNPQRIKRMPTTVDGEIFDYKVFSSIKLRMIGVHQIVNAVLAIEAMTVLQKKGWKISNQQIKKGIMQTFWPGRMEKLNERPLVLIDGAHNEQGVDLLRQNIESVVPNKKITFVIGMMKDKPYEEMIEKMEEKAKMFYFISPDPIRGFDSIKEAKRMHKKGIGADIFENIDDIIQFIRASSTEEIIVAFGSLYLIGDLRKAWKKAKRIGQKENTQN